MVQDLLTMARRGSARQEVVDLAALTGAYLASTELRQLRGEHPQVRIAAAVAPEPLTVRGVPAHLTKILMNLAANGAEAHQGPGEVRIAAGRRRLQQPLEGFETVPAGDYVCLTVGDTGTGIAPADRGRIFEPFFTKKRLRRSGTGLGMTVVWSALKEMDGFIQVSSGEGRGTIFTLFFPFTPDAPAPAAGAPEEAAMRGTERVLVVDDEPQQRQIATAMLQQLGYRVAAAPGGEEALAALERQPADILLLDMLMDPGIDGCETYRRIIARHPGQRAVIASGYADSDRLREVRRLGAGGLIRKPYRLEELARAVRAELERDAAPPRAEEGGDR
jgi:CheY-like chemotaxis protein